MKKNPHSFAAILGFIIICAYFSLSGLSARAATSSPSAVTGSSTATSSISQDKAIITQSVSSSTVATSTKATTTYMLSGKASWYAYQGGMFAASPEFPIGSKLRVISQSNPKKFVDVVVNDIGPNRKLHPDRVVDLDKVAFQALASLGTGVISVRIEPLSIGKGVLTPSAIVAASSATAAKPKQVANTQTNNKLKLTSQAGIVISAKTGKVLWSKNPQAQMPLASLTKIVAAKVFLDTKPKLTKVVTYKKSDDKYTYQWANPGEIARLRVKEGETMTVKDALYAALIGSANNSVETLVRNSGLTRQQFIARMNKYAKSIGATQTRFVEPTGLAPTNVSSVKDYALISRNVLANPTISSISSAKSYTFATKNTKQKHTIKNTNKLMAWTNLKITGSKTGYLDEAKYCLMTKAKSSKGEVIAVTFGTPTKTASFNETKDLLNYGFSTLN